MFSGRNLIHLLNSETLKSEHCSLVLYIRALVLLLQRDTSADVVCSCTELGTVLHKTEVCAVL